MKIGPLSVVFRPVRRDKFPAIISEDDQEHGYLYDKIAPGGSDKLPAPIASVSIGTAGLRRSRKFVNAMRAAGCLDRLQSVTVCDYNQTNIDLWKATQSDDTADITIFPEYNPVSDGFQRKTQAFQKYYGRIERDLEEMVNDMLRKGHAAGTTPQIILEWIGFGGHAQLSYKFHDMIANAFPEATFLPIFCLPNERMLEKNMRENVWSNTQDIYGNTLSILTDNAITHDLESIDRRLTIAIAAVEAAYRSSPEFGTLPEIASMFDMTHSKWLGVSERSIPLRVENGSLIRGRDDSTIHTIKELIWSAAGHNNRDWLGYYAPPRVYDEQRIVVSLPVTRRVLNDIRDDVMDQLLREGFEEGFQGAKIGFAPANFNWNRITEEDDVVYGHVTKVFATAQEAQPSLERILTPGYRINGHRVHSFLTRGQAMVEELGANVL